MEYPIKTHWKLGTRWAHHRHLFYAHEGDQDRVRQEYRVLGRVCSCYIKFDKAPYHPHSKGPLIEKTQDFDRNASVKQRIAKHGKNIGMTV